MPSNDFGTYGTYAGKLVKHLVQGAGKQGAQPGLKAAAETLGKRGKNFSRDAGTFVKHVVPAAAKPIHSLWHEILGFFFLAFAAIGLYKAVRNAETLGIGKLIILAVFIVVLAGYGISSFLKARRISRS